MWKLSSSSQVPKLDGLQPSWSNIHIYEKVTYLAFLEALWATDSQNEVAPSKTRQLRVCLFVKIEKDEWGLAEICTATVLWFSSWWYFVRIFPLNNFFVWLIVHYVLKMLFCKHFYTMFALFFFPKWLGSSVRHHDLYSSFIFHTGIHNHKIFFSWSSIIYKK